LWERTRTRRQELARGADAHRPSVVSRSELLSKETPWTLVIQVKSATDLKAMDFLSNSSDPYCVVTVERQKQRTKGFDKTVNPVWNEELRYRIDENRGTVEAVVWDKNMILDEEIGMVEVELLDVLRNAEGVPKDYELILLDEGGERAGILHLSMSHEKFTESERKNSKTFRGSAFAGRARRRGHQQQTLSGQRQRFQAEDGKVDWLKKLRGLDQLSIACHVNAAIVVLHLMYTTLLREVFQLLKCVGYGNERRLVIQGDVVCFNSVQIILFFVLIPLVVYPFLLYWKLHSLYHKTRGQWSGFETATFNAVCLIYKDEYIWWESVVLFRRLCCVALFTSIHDNLHWRGWGMGVLCFLIVLAHVQARPFNSSEVHHLEMATLSILVVLAFRETAILELQTMGIYRSLNNNEDWSHQTAFSIIATILLVLPFFLATPLLYKVARREVRELSDAYRHRQSKKNFQMSRGGGLPQHLLRGGGLLADRGGRVQRIEKTPGASPSRVASSNGSTNGTSEANRADDDGTGTATNGVNGTSANGVNGTAANGVNGTAANGVNGSGANGVNGTGTAVEPKVEEFKVDTVPEEADDGVWEMCDDMEDLPVTKPMTQLPPPSSPVTPPRPAPSSNGIKPALAPAMIPPDEFYDEEEDEEDEEGVDLAVC